MIPPPIPVLAQGTQVITPWRYRTELRQRPHSFIICQSDLTTGGKSISTMRRMRHLANLACTMRRDSTGRRLPTGRPSRSTGLNNRCSIRVPDTVNDGFRPSEHAAASKTGAVFHLSSFIDDRDTDVLSSEIAMTWFLVHRSSRMKIIGPGHPCHVVKECNCLTRHRSPLHRRALQSLVDRLTICLHSCPGASKGDMSTLISHNGFANRRAPISPVR